MQKKADKKQPVSSFKKTLNYEKIISDISYRALLTKETDKFYAKILATIGKALSVSHAHISKIHKPEDVLSVIYQWTNVEHASHKNQIQQIPVKIFPNLKSAVDRQRLLNIKDVSTLRDQKEKNFLTAFKIKALLCVPIETGAGALNFLAVNDCDNKRKWTAREIRLLKTIANIIGQTMNRETLQTNIIHSKNHYAQVIDSIQDAICVVDKNHKIASYNRVFAKKVGLPIKKIKGLPCSRVIPLFENNLFNSTCMGTSCNGVNQTDTCLIADVFESGEAVQKLETGEKNGKIHYYQINIFPTKNRKSEVQFAVLSIRDVTKNMAAEEDYLRLSELQRKIIDNIPAIIITYDKKGTVTSVNKYFYKISEKRHYVGKNIFFDSEFNKKHGLLSSYRKLLNKGVPFSKENCLFKNKKLKSKIQYLNVVAVPLYDKNNQIEGGVTMYIANTEAFIAKAKLVEMNKTLGKKVTLKTKQLVNANKELKEAIELKTKFMADASHELRTPLTIIRGNLEMVEEDIASKRQAEAMESLNLVKREVDVIKNILSDLLTLTGSSALHKSLIFEKIDIIATAKTIIKSLSALAKEKNIDLRFFGSEKLILSANEAWIEKMFLNLIHNGIKYSQKKGFIKISINKKNDQAVISIEDNGIGIPRKDLPYIFERFYRVDKSRSRAEGGTGLGLAICKWVVTSHQGKITAQSQLGKGTKFTIKLPLNNLLEN